MPGSTREGLDQPRREEESADQEVVPDDISVPLALPREKQRAPKVKGIYLSAMADKSQADHGEDELPDLCSPSKDKHMPTAEGCLLELFPCISMGTGQLFCFPLFNISLMIISEIFCLLETWPKEIRKRKCHRLLSMNYFSHFLMPEKAVLTVGKQIMGYAVFKLLVSEMLENAICTCKYSVLVGNWQQ